LDGGARCAIIWWWLNVQLLPDEGHLLFAQYLAMLDGPLKDIPLEGKAVLSSLHFRDDLLCLRVGKIDQRIPDISRWCLNPHRPKTFIRNSNNVMIIIA
jgi:hypothetical protein